MDGNNTINEDLRKPITCDQVSWLLDIADRYLPKENNPSISRQRDMKKYGMLYEIMEIAGLRFEDYGAMHNGTPNDAKDNDKLMKGF